jgi:hypothetical protein
MSKEVKRRNFNQSFKRRENMTAEELEHDQIYNGDELIEKILNSKKIRYDLLNDLFDHIPSKYETVTMYIDLLSILNSLYNPNILESITSFDGDKKRLMSSNIINMAAHFRNYFATRKGKYTNIIFYYSLDESKYETEDNCNYRKDYYFKRFSKSSEFMVMNKLIKDNIELCEIISDYLPHIYFVNTKEINPLLVPYYYIEQSLDNELNIIYSNDKMNMLSCLSNSHDTYLLSASFGKVVLYDKGSLLELYSNSKDYDDSKYSINPDLLPLAYAISGHKKYNIDGLKGYGQKKALNLIQRLLDDGVISNIKYNNKKLLIDDLSNDKKLSPEQISIISDNLDIINPSYMFRKLSKADILSSFSVKDLCDMESLIQINRGYYEKYPLQLEELLIGEDYN